jgi:hypothetical protein
VHGKSSGSGVIFLSLFLGDTVHTRLELALAIGIWNAALGYLPALNTKGVGIDLFLGVYLFCFLIIWVEIYRRREIRNEQGRERGEEMARGKGRGVW